MERGLKWILRLKKIQPTKGDFFTKLLFYPVKTLLLPKSLLKIGA